MTTEREAERAWERWANSPEDDGAEFWSIEEQPKRHFLAGYAAASARVEELEKALREYGRHHESCEEFTAFEGQDIPPCDCGFADLLAKP